MLGFPREEGIMRWRKIEGTMTAESCRNDKMPLLRAKFTNVAHLVILLALTGLHRALA